MSERLIRLNALLGRELSALLHRKFRGEALAVTITRVEVSPDLRRATVFFSTPDGDPEERQQKFLIGIGGTLKRILSRRIPLHHFPDLQFSFDRAQSQVLRVYGILDGLAESGKSGPSRCGGEA